jgi:hypothetical protein
MVSVNNENYRSKVVDIVYQKNKYQEGKELLLEWWNNAFPEFSAEKIDSNKSSIYSNISDLLQDTTKLNTIQKDVIISIAGILSSISFFEEPLENHYRKSFEWLDLVRPFVKDYQSNFTTWFWNKYLDLITYNGETIHIMEIPIEEQTDFVKIAYCDYLRIKNQDGIKEIRRILNNVVSENPIIQIMKHRTLCDIYADSPSKRNNKQIKECAKKIFSYASKLKDSSMDNNIKYKWYLNSANYTTMPGVDEEFYTLPDTEDYEKCISELESYVIKCINEERETIKALLTIKDIVNFAIRNGHFKDSSRLMLWFIALTEAGNHTKAVDVYYVTYKYLMEILLSIRYDAKHIEMPKVLKRFPDIDDIFFNEESQEYWEKLDYLLRKKILPTSPLGRVTQRLIQDFLKMAVKDLREINYI